MNFAAFIVKASGKCKETAIPDIVVYYSLLKDIRPDIAPKVVGCKTTVEMLSVAHKAW